MNKESFWDESVMVNLAYYDIFNFPLTEKELSKYSSHSSSLTDKLKFMSENKMIFESSGYYSIQKNVEELSQVRVKAEQLASEKMSSATKFSRFLIKIPFIESICLSGSISKGVMYENSDIDYFLITSPGKVWRTKFLVVSFRILLLFNSRKNFCINYIIDKDHLLLEEKNRFTATELVTMIPTFGYEQYLEILNLNKWVNHFYKDVKVVAPKHIIFKSQKSIMSYIINLILDNSLGDWLENWFMRYSKKRYRNKFESKISEQYLDLAFKSTPHVSKSHGMNFQEKVCNRFLNKIKDLEKQHNIIFDENQFYYKNLIKSVGNPYV